MNIFYLDHDPTLAAQWMVDKHIVKMPLESCQMLSTAHRLIDGIPQKVEFTDEKGQLKRKTVHLLPGEDIIIAPYEDGRIAPQIINRKCYNPTHRNHPSTVWTMSSRENYLKHVDILRAMLLEYTARYGRQHKSASTVLEFLATPPKNLKSGPLTDPTPAMSDYYKVEGDSVQSYRNYYAGSKWRFAKWKHGIVPTWYTSRVLSMWFRGDALQRALDAETVLKKKTPPSHPDVMKVVYEAMFKDVKNSSPVDFGRISLVQVTA